MKRCLIILLCLLVVLTACTRQRPDDIQSASAVTRYVRSGTQGLEVNFVKDLPPRQLYDTGDLVVLSELRNLGNYDLDGNKCVIELRGFDSSIVRGINERQQCGDLPGKSEFFIDGGFGIAEFKSSSIRLPRDVDIYQPPLVATVCYEYRTVASPQVCIDPAFFDVSSQQKICDVRDFSLGGGQGAPIAVTFVNADMVESKAIFQIDVADVGGGRVVSPKAGLSQCPGSLQYDDFDEVRYSVELSGGRLVKCAPQDFIVRLTNGKGKIVCTFDVGRSQAYETPLRIQLDYNYMKSISFPIEIIKTPN